MSEPYKLYNEGGTTSCLVGGANIGSPFLALFVET